MRAFAFESTDKPAALMSIPKPEVAEDGILISVRAASVNGFDVFQASGLAFGMMEHAFPTVVGRDFAGVVEAVGPNARGFSAGDEVFGFIPAAPPLKSGSFAEYVAGGPELVLARKPTEVDFPQAAALPLAGSAALDLLEAVHGKDGDVVLIVGATGGVGTLALQIAAHRGLTVIATARPDQAEWARELGAAETIDYSSVNVADAVRSRHPDGIAALIDLIDQKEALAALASVVRPGGHVASVLSAVDVDQLARRRVTGSNVNAAPTADKLRLLGELAASGALRVQIQGIYELENAGEAIAAFPKGTRGKLIVRA